MSIICDKCGLQITPGPDRDECHCDIACHAAEVSRLTEELKAAKDAEPFSLTLATIPDPEPPREGYPTIVQHHELKIADTSYSERSHLVESDELNARLKGLYGQLLAATQRAERAEAKRDALEAACKLADGFANLARKDLTLANARIERLRRALSATRVWGLARDAIDGGNDAQRDIVRLARAADSMNAANAEVDAHHDLASEGDADAE